MIIAYIIVAGLLCLGSFYKLLLTLLFLRQRRTVQPPPLPDGAVPFVTVQLPLYNEKLVVERLIRAVASLDYPADRLEIQVLDDSTDETSQIVEELAREFPLRHVRRAERTDYKAGALAEGTRSARGELIAIFDADFVPGPDFLRWTVPYFRDPSVGVVQARWDFLNAHLSLLTRLQALYLTAHFRIEHAARASVGAFFHFNGSAGVWRKVAIADAGGWRASTLTEDLDLSYRAHLKGWRFRFLRAVGVASELPETIPAMQAQQFRWTKGMAQVARQQLPPVWKARVPLWKKVDATLHLLSPLTYLTTLLGAVGLIPYLLMREGTAISGVEAAAGSLLAASLGWNLLYFVVAEWDNGTLSPRRCLDILAGVPLGVALSLNGTRALFSGLVSNGGVFVRTPKRGTRTDMKKYEASSPAALPWEFLLAVCFLLAIFMSPPQRAGILLLLGSGFWYLTLGAVKRIYARTLGRAR